MYGKCVYTPTVARVKERWDFRVEPETDRLVRQAAANSQRTLTDFVIDAAVLEAERLLADRTEFALDADSAETWDTVNRRRARDLPGLRRLMQRPAPFAEE